MPDARYDLGLCPAAVQPRATLIVSVYRDWQKLECILQSLRFQTVRQFQVIVSEDGDDPELAKALQPYLQANPAVVHLTQPDRGFRKNRALNKAIRAAASDYLIFIDGDCVPHAHFVASHIGAAEDQRITAGRRVELGPRFSQRLIQTPAWIQTLSATTGYLAWMPALLADGIKNPESGVYSTTLQAMASGRPLTLVGCNFSCHRAALEAINGFNEDYEAAGIGEDSDLEWRFARAGYETKNAKFLTPLFHLYHPRGYSLSQANVAIYETTRANDEWFCRRGLK